ncbi:baseplate tail-tube junction protein [bacterium]|nr:baseplate tail-tube junction protein [bacterium]
MAGFINVDSIVNNTFKSATKKFMSSLDSAVGKSSALKPKYIYPKDIDKLSTANYMIIYVYDNKNNSTTFAPINTQIAKSKIQNDLARQLTDCISIKISDNAKNKLKQYKNAINSWLKDSLKDIFNSSTLSELGSKLGIDLETPEWLKETGEFLKNNQLTRGIRDLVSNIDMPNLPGLNLGDFSLSDYVDIDIDGEKMKGILKDKLQDTINQIRGVKSVEEARMLKSEAGDDFELVTSVVLPLPQNEISYGYKIPIDTAETKTAQAIADVVGAGLSGYKNTRKEDKSSTWLGRQINKGAALISGVADSVTQVGNTIAAQGPELLYGMMGSGGKALYQNEYGVVRDPLTVFTWSMPDARTFTYEYTMAPRDSNELYDIWNIIKTLKFYSHMEIGQDGHSVRYFNFPGRFKIKYYTEGNENVWLGKTKILGLSDLTTTIDGTNVGFILNDFDKISGNPPKIIKLSMTFKELSLLNRDDINEGY